jgi:molybdopterin synthase catalytic subunit
MISRFEAKISEEPIGLQNIASVSPFPSHGAQVLFLGIVRNSNLGRDVTAVAYDAFAPLAEQVFLEICQDAQKRWGTSLQFKILHRTGTLKVGDVSVLIAVSSPHRGPAYLASRYVLEQMKIRAPIWKKEFYVDGESEWLQGHALCDHSHEEVAQEELKHEH